MTVHADVFALPVLPGREGLLQELGWMRHRIDDYRGSRAKVGITMERVYYTAAPLGDMVTAYTEYSEDHQAGGYAEVMRAFSTSAPSAIPCSGVELFDRDSATRARVLHGLELPELFERMAGTRELLVDYSAVRGKRRDGFAFPLQITAGKTEKWRAFCATLQGERRPGFEEFNLRNGFSVHRVALTRAPECDISCVYVEGEVDKYRTAISSGGSFEEWFARELADLHGLDPRQGPPSRPEPVWDWVRDQDHG